MNDQQLTKLLRDADAARPADVTVGALELGVLERRAGERRAGRRRVAMASAGAVVVAVVASAAWLNGDRRIQMAEEDVRQNVDRAALEVGASPPHASENTIDAAALRAEIAALEKEIEVKESFIAAMRRAETNAEVASEIAALEREMEGESDYLADAELRRAFHETAAIRLAFADELSEDAGDLEAAAAEYRDVARCFPNTLWAKTATERLAHFGAM